VQGFKTCGIYPFDPKAVLDHDPCDQMVTLQTSGVDSTTASTLVHRDAENSDSIAQVAAALDDSVKVIIWHLIPGTYLQWLQVKPS